MTDPEPCSECGTPIPANARWGMCPKCLLDPSAQSFTEKSNSLRASLGGDGRRFADYELGQQIGRGGMGVVYEALQISLRRPVALKMILDSHLASPVVRRRFAFEAEAAAKLDHPNIVSIYEVGEHLDQPFLSMKLVQGEGLNTKIARGDLGVGAKKADQNKSAIHARETTVARLMITVARAVHHAHLHGVLHRDLKPGNVLIDQEGHPHLTDFGLAKMLDGTDAGGNPAHLTRSSAIVGTPSYMSPEQASNQRLTAASDVYSLGAILYELLSGQPPFKATTLLETLRMVVEQEPKRPRSVHAMVDSDLDTICMKCLEKSPEARYTSALALAEDLERWLRQEPIQARPAGTGLRLRRWVKRNPVGASLIVSLCVCLAVTLGLLHVAAKKAEDDAIARAWVLERLTHEIEELWSKPDQSLIFVPARDLAVLDNRSPRRPDPNALTLTFALTIGNNPVGQAQAYAPLLAALEQQTEKKLGRQVFLDLRIYKANSWSSLWDVRREADVQRMSQLTYVRLRQAGLDVQPLAMERNADEGVIFARAGAGCTNLAQIAVQRAVFAHTNSVVSFLAKVCLARAGLCVTNFKSFTNLDAPNHSTMRTAQEGSAQMEEDIEVFTHKEVIQKVLAHEYEAGVATFKRFENERRRNGQLIELARFPVSVDVYVARAGLEPGVVAVLHESFLALNDKTMLGRARRSMIAGLERAKDSDFDDFRQMLTNEWVFFETGQRPATNDIRMSHPSGR